MPQKHFFVGLGGGKSVFFSSKRSYLKWAVSTRDGFKHLMLLPIFALVWLRTRKYKKEIEEMREAHRKEIEEMREAR